MQSIQQMLWTNDHVITKKNEFVNVEDCKKGGKKLEDKRIRNNQAIVEGEIITELRYSHTIFGEKYYDVKLKVSRLSQSTDMVPLLVSERLVDVNDSYVGKFVRVCGPIRSYTKHEGEKNHLVLSLLVKDWMIVDQLDEEVLNMIYLDGYVCKLPVYRITPLGKEITDIFLAVNRLYGHRSDYIPLILWGKNAREGCELKLGSHIQIWGRFQSRVYQKKVDADIYKNFTTFEISVNDIINCDKEEDYYENMSGQYVADSGLIPRFL